MLKRLITFLVFFLPILAHAALPTTAVFEVRSTATAGNVNGGCFNSARGGNDYTLQDTAQINGLTNLSTSGAGATTVTSASAPFTSNMVGNCLHITSTATNFQVGWYEIVTFTDTSNVILDRTPSSAGAGSGGTFYVGGALSLNSTLDDDVFEAVTNGNIFYIKAGTYSLGEGVSIAKSCSLQNACKVIGYNSSRTDEPTADNRPLVNGAANNFAWTGNYWFLRNIRWTGTAVNGFTVAPHSFNKNLRAYNSSTSANSSALRLGAGATIADSEAISLKGYGVTFTDVGMLRDSYIHDSLIGVRGSAITGFAVIKNNIIHSNTSKAIELLSTNTSPSLIGDNTIYGSENKTGTGIDLGSSQDPVSVENNIIYGFATGVACQDAVNQHYSNFNDYYNNTADVSQFTKGASDVALAPTFTNVTQKVNVGTVSSSTNVLTDTGADFSSITDNVDIVNIVSGTGTGFATGAYLITAHGATTLTLSSNLTSSGSGSAIVYQITLGRNFGIGTNLKALGSPGAFQAGFSTSYKDIGAVQRQEAGGATGVSKGRIQVGM